MPKKRTIQQLTDPRALRAMAHPIRLELIGLLRRGGPLTATQAGKRIGESPASCSFHLRQLAKYGLVEEAGGGKGRERPWRATAIATEWPTREGLSEEAEAASEMLSRVLAESYFESVLEWLERQSKEDAEWADAAIIGDVVAYLTPAELRELEGKLRAFIEPYQKRLEDSSRLPAGSRPVNLIAFVFPLAEESQEPK